MRDDGSRGMKCIIIFMLCKDVQPSRNKNPAVGYKNTNSIDAITTKFMPTNYLD
jgi:hypothetical protein